MGPAVIDALPAAIVEASAQLAPATLGDARRFLGPTLALVAPAGMSEGDQKAWLAAAQDTLSGIPSDLLEAGCRAARKKVDHPSKIVAAIFTEVEAEWSRRRKDLVNARRMAEAALLPSAAPAKAEPVTPEQIEEIKAEVGLKTTPYQEARKPTGVAQRMPTSIDLAEIAKDLGINTAAPVAGSAVSIEGLTVGEIFAQRDRMRAG